MLNCITFSPNKVLSILPTKPLNQNFLKSHSFDIYQKKPFGRGSIVVAKSGLSQLNFDDAEFFIREAFGRAESYLYTISDVTANNLNLESVKQVEKSGDWLSGITFYMETVLKVLKDGLSTLHVPYSYGFAIIMLTILVKAATFPLTRKQVESAMAMRSLQPQIKAMQKRYAGDQEKMQIETARLYKLAGINPLAGCLPTLATIPVWIGLYRALSNVADEGLLNEGFFWIPSLAGPTTVAARQSGSGISWLFPFIDGQPPLGWPETFAYLVLPVLLVVSQYISVQIMQSSQANDPNMKSSQIITNFLPLMIGYFALSVPSGLSLYWLTNNVLSTAQQVWLQKLGGAKNPVSKLSGNLFEEELTEMKKPIVDSITTRKVSTIEKPVASGPSPGDRFKQLKEQEARKRRQREEEKRRADEVAANAAQKTEGRHIDDATSTPSDSEAVGESTSSKNGSPSSNVHSSDHNGVNGNLSTTRSKEDKNTTSDLKESKVQEREKEEAIAAAHVADIKDTNSD